MNLPATMAAHYDRIQEFKMTVHTLAVELLRGFAVALDLEEDHFAKWHDLRTDPVCLLTTVTDFLVSLIHLLKGSQSIALSYRVLY